MTWLAATKILQTNRININLLKLNHSSLSLSWMSIINQSTSRKSWAASKNKRQKLLRGNKFIMFVKIAPKKPNKIISQLSPASRAKCWKLKRRRENQNRDQRIRRKNLFAREKEIRIEAKDLILSLILLTMFKLFAPKTKDDIVIFIYLLSAWWIDFASNNFLRKDQ